MLVPPTSTASLLKGMWFVFHEQGSVVALWASSASGAERLFVDGTQVSHSRNVKFSTSHAFELRSAPYVVELKVRKLADLNFVCTLFREGSPLQTLVTEFVPHKSVWLRILPVIAIACLVYVALQMPPASAVLAGSAFAVLAGCLYFSYKGAFLVKRVHAASASDA